MQLADPQHNLRLVIMPTVLKRIRSWEVGRIGSTSDAGILTSFLGLILQHGSMQTCVSKEVVGG